VALRDSGLRSDKVGRVHRRCGATATTGVVNRARRCAWQREGFIKGKILFSDCLRKESSVRQLSVDSHPLSATIADAHSRRGPIARIARGSTDGSGTEDCELMTENYHGTATGGYQSLRKLSEACWAQARADYAAAVTCWTRGFTSPVCSSLSRLRRWR